MYVIHKDNNNFDMPYGLKCLCFILFYIYLYLFYLLNFVLCNCLIMFCTQVSQREVL